MNLKLNFWKIYYKFIDFKLRYLIELLFSYILCKNNKNNILNQIYIFGLKFIII